MGQKQDVISLEGGLSIAKPTMPVHTSENQDQPSPISVLEPSFVEHGNTIPETSGGIKPLNQELEMPPQPNLLDKSPPIESTVRTFSCDDSCSETSTAYP